VRGAPAAHEPPRVVMSSGEASCVALGRDSHPMYHRRERRRRWKRARGEK
jgi:hypothetical protein